MYLSSLQRVYRVFTHHFSLHNLYHVAYNDFGILQTHNLLFLLAIFMFGIRLKFLCGEQLSHEITYKTRTLTGCMCCR
nr:MAG TPA: hypothetical protein [Crassvirales sp.]